MISLCLAYPQAGWRTVPAHGGTLCAIPLMNHERQDSLDSHMTDPDQALIRAAVSGDGDAYADVVERYQGPVSAVLWRFTRDRLILEELVQDTFVEAFLSLRRFRSGSPFYPWLRTIATRVGYRHWRRQKLERDRQAVLAEWRRVQGEPESSGRPSDTAEALYRLLELMDPKDRLVLTLQYFEGCSTKEIAERAGWTLTLVKVRAFRARQRLRALLLEAEKTDHEKD